MGRTIIICVQHVAKLASEISPLPPQRQSCGVTFAMARFFFHVRRPNVSSTLYVGGKGASRKLRIATCGLHLHVWDLKAHVDCIRTFGISKLSRRAVEWRRYPAHMPNRKRKPEVKSLDVRGPPAQALPACMVQLARPTVQNVRGNTVRRL